MATNSFTGYQSPVLPQSNAIIILPEGAQTLSADNSGKICMISQATAYTITLPTVSPGLNFKFVINFDDTNVVQIKESTAATNIVGNAIVGPTAAATINIGAGTNTVRFSTTCNRGDSISLFCDGISWYCQGISSSNVAATGIIFT